MLIIALTARPQQTATGGGGPQGDVPTVEQQMRVLTEKLDLTRPQQARITPILEELHDATEKLVDDKSLSREERLAKVRPLRYKANKQIHDMLNDDQKKKLDEYLDGPHPEMHGSLNGAATPEKK